MLKGEAAKAVAGPFASLQQQIQTFENYLQPDYLPGWDYRVYQDPAALLGHIYEMGVREAE